MSLAWSLTILLFPALLGGGAEGPAHELLTFQTYLYDGQFAPWKGVEVYLVSKGGISNFGTTNESARIEIPASSLTADVVAVMFCASPVTFQCSVVRLDRETVWKQPVIYVHVASEVVMHVDEVSPADNAEAPERSRASPGKDKR